jgi:hypothetical protein
VHSAAIVRSKATIFGFILVSLVAVLVPSSHGAAGAATSGPTPSISILRLGNAWSAATGYSRYPTVIVDRANAVAAAALPSTTRVLVYHAGVDININWTTGVSYADALANGWLLKDSSGNLIHNAGYPDNYIGDIGSPSYQQRWATDVASYLTSVGADGVYIDDVLGDPALLTNNIWPAKYPTHQSWNDAMASFIAYVGPYMKAHGLYIAVNATNFIPGDAGSNDGTNNITWWQRLAPNVNGLISEYWQQNPNNVGQMYSDCKCTWTGWWSNFQKLETTAQTAGDDFFSVIYGAGADTHAIRYEKASFLMDWNGKDGGMIWNPTDTGDPWNADWTTDVGLPTAPRYAVGIGWRRDFTGGTVVINPSATASQTFALGGSYVQPGGTSTTSVALAPLSAMVLTGASVPSLPANTSLPAVSGTPQEGQQLQASTGSWSTAISAYGYQWFRCDSTGAGCSALSGATGATYVAATADVGHTLRVTVAATGGGGTTSAQSTATPLVSSAPVVSAAPNNTASPAVTGTAQAGSQLSTSTGTWSGTVAGYAYQWYRCDNAGGSCAMLSGATSATYNVVSTDVGLTIRSKVFATGPGGTSSASSAATPLVSAAPAPPPANTSLPVISGTAQDGQQLSVSQGSWSTTVSSFAYQWNRCDSSGGACAGITGATGLTYRAGTSDVGHTLRATVSATGTGGTSTVSSAASAVVAPIPAPAPTTAPTSTAPPLISGQPVAGKTVSAQTGSWSGSPTSITVQWLRCSSGSCSSIGGATGTSYQLTGSDTGSTLMVSVVATNAGGSATTLSGAFGPIHGSKN